MKPKSASSALVVVCLMVLTACTTLPGKQSQTIDGARTSYAMQGKGDTTVVFVTGLGSQMDLAWGDVFTDVAEFAPVFAYDRAGYGDSVEEESGGFAQEAAEETIDMVVPGAFIAVELIKAASKSRDSGELSPVTGNQVAQHLHHLLRRADIEPPYILVGHSLGGMYVQNFAHTYPNDVSGLVLVDSRPIDLTRLCDRQIGKDKCLPPPFMLKMFPKHVKAEFAGIETTENQLRAAGTLPDIPVIVLASTKASGGTPKSVVPLKIKLQREHAHRQLQGKFILASESGHFIQKDDPELVVHAIRQVIMQADNKGATQATQ